MPGLGLILAFLIWLFLLAILAAALAQWWVDRWFSRQPNIYGILFRLLTRRNVRLERTLERVLIKARAAGFHLERPIIVEILPWIRKLSFYGITYTGKVYLEDNLIAISAACVKKFSDAELEVLVAHEVGHIIWDQGRRLQVHPVFQNVSAVTEEEFADQVSVAVSGEAVAQAVWQKYPTQTQRSNCRKRR